MTQFQKVLVSILNNKFNHGLALADIGSADGSYEVLVSRIQGAINDLPEGSDQQVEDATMAAIRTSLGMS